MEPAWVRPEYANLLPLALANGVFECSPRRIWSQPYSYNWPEITLDKVETILGALQKVGLLFTWTNGDSKVWGYWVGIEKPGRLPGKSRWGKNEAIGPEPPQEELRKFLDSNGFHRALFERLGFGLGSGSGTSVSKEQKPRIRSSKKQLEPAGFAEFRKLYPKKKAKLKAREAFQKLSPPPELLSSILEAIERYKASEDWRREKGQFIPYPASFLKGRRWEDEIEPNGQGSPFAAMTQEELHRRAEAKRAQAVAT